MYDYNPCNSDSMWNQGLNYAGIVFTVIFLMEAIIKILAMGFIMHQRAYLRDNWNVIDFIIVVTG